MNKFCFFLLVLLSTLTFAESTPKDLVKLSLGVVKIQGRPAYLSLNYENKKSGIPTGKIQEMQVLR